ncbi:hypothetical protein CIRG_06652 [Coccidioides immitis RMSCC 2394]|uniref:Uncharacterized protein n=1 Tax=Coccidioides immitis RMSCC 2394 TaxID=404692 RepID=A0A0J6YE72_COCIT|nr:hypothetical protein CIRG_06652 [Coccidioides immitis RMSCC 2394]
MTNPSMHPQFRSNTDLSVVTTTVGPASLEVDDLLVAEAVEDVHLALDEFTSISGGDIGVEERVDVGAENVDDTAKLGSIGLPDVEGLGGGDWAVVASLLEGEIARNR